MEINEKKLILELHKRAIKYSLLTENKNRKINGSTANISSRGVEMIKFHEGDPRVKPISGRAKHPVYKRYKDGGGIDTIGWGHTATASKYTKITLKQAEMLLNKDLDNAVGCLNRMFRRWENSDINYYLTQNMFDSLVSIVFNCGCQGTLKGDFMQDYKRGDLVTASKKIKTFRTSQAGHKGRREEEAKLFLM